MNKAMQFKARIKNLALKNHIPAQAALQNYMLERLLERISLSGYKNRVVLKGGMLIASIVGISSRTTMDMDATMRGFPLSEEAIRNAFLEICEIPLGDGVKLVFDHVTPIREEDEYGGFRVAIIALYEGINTPLKIDITTGDVLTPGAVQYAFQSNFENKMIEVWAYNLETILAEKVETILRRSVLNTRPRDFYDVFILIKTQPLAIGMEVFRMALQATCEKRKSLDALKDRERILRTIQSDGTMRGRWDRYSKEYFYANGIDFDEVIEVLVEILRTSFVG
jgi:predicted nucleotidyltransferase component of viral defense system